MYISTVEFPDNPKNPNVSGQICMKTVENQRKPPLVKKTVSCAITEPMASYVALVQTSDYQYFARRWGHKSNLVLAVKESLSADG